jgi:hypothetical protein
VVLLVRGAPRIGKPDFVVAVAPDEPFGVLVRLPGHDELGSALRTVSQVAGQTWARSTAVYRTVEILGLRGC